MLSKDTARELLNTYSDSSIEFDSSNNTFLTNKEFSDIVVHYDDQTGSLNLLSSLGNLPHEQHAQLMITKELLCANYLKKVSLGKTISLSPNSNEIIYEATYDDASNISFHDFILNFAECSDFWQERIQDLTIEFSTTENDDLDDYDLDFSKGVNFEGAEDFIEELDEDDFDLSEDPYSEGSQLAYAS